MNQSTDEKFLDLARAIALKHVDRSSYSVFLFGSRAKESAHRLSDMDIGFLGGSPIPKATLSAIAEELNESAVPYNLDLVDFFTASDDFRKESLREIVIWNKTEHLKKN